MKKLKFGVIGNIGPEADSYFQDVLARKEIECGVLTEQEHMSMIVVKNPDIPDRSAAIMGVGEDPVPELVESARVLEHNNVPFAIMACSAAHYFLNAVQQQTSVYLVDMLKTTVQFIQETQPEVVVGVLGHNGTYHSGIYQNYLDNAGLAHTKLNAEQQEQYIHSAIFGSKTTKQASNGEFIRQADGLNSGVIDANVERLTKGINILVEKGVTTIILSYFGLAKVQPQLMAKFPQLTFIDPMELVAEYVLAIYEQADEYVTLGECPTVVTDIAAIKSSADLVNYVATKALQA
ncbi:aspartate/glutamate racemase family protein [Shewanella gaetbuli]